MRERININKVAKYAVVINAVQIALALLLTLYMFFGRSFSLSGVAEKVLVVVMAMIVSWGALIDIREAFSAKRVAQQTDMLEDAYTQLESLNSTLRAQRHDFMNQLQVVYSLMEMQEIDEAKQYIEMVYGDIQRVGKFMKTSIPAVNALLAAKIAYCDEKNVKVETEFKSSWSDIPVPGWEMCRVLGNLIDNAMDAIAANDDPRLRLSIGETLQEFTFTVENNGPAIPKQIRETIFQMGFTTKKAGRGMGLHIVSEILAEHGGTIELQTEDGSTKFTGHIPRETGETEGRAFLERKAAKEL